MIYDILEIILNFTIENIYTQNKINQIYNINKSKPKIWKNVLSNILQQNSNFLKEIDKLFRVNKIWNKIIYKKTIKIFEYISTQKIEKKKSRKVNFNIPLLYSEEFIISYTLNHYSFDYLLNVFSNYNINYHPKNNLILKNPEPADFFNMKPQCEQCRYSIYDVEFLKYFKYMEENYPILECSLCHHKQNWLNKVIKYIKNGFSHKLVLKIKNIINILNNCNKCRNFEICLYHKIDYKYYDIYKMLINKIYTTNNNIQSINNCAIF